MYHIFLNHLSASGHLGCFHVLVIMNSATMSVGYTCLFQFWFPWCICPAVDCCIIWVLFPVFKGISMLSSIVAILVCIPTNSVRGFPFLHTLSASHRVQKTVLYISVSFAVSYTGLLLPSF